MKSRENESKNPPVTSRYWLVAVRGAMTLPAVIIVSAIVLEVAISIVVVSRVVGTSGLANRLGSEALYAARSGAEDAIIRIIRYKNCPGTGCPTNYSFTVGARTAEVAICDNGGGSKTVKAVGTAGAYKKMIKATLVSDSTTGAVSVNTFSETATEALTCP